MSSSQEKKEIIKTMIDMAISKRNIYQFILQIVNNCVFKSQLLRIVFWKPTKSRHVWLEAQCSGVEYKEAVLKKKQRQFIFNCTYENKSYFHSDLCTLLFKIYTQQESTVGKGCQKRIKKAVTVTTNAKAPHALRDMALEVSKGVFETLENLIPDDIKRMALANSYDTQIVPTKSEHDRLLQWALRTLDYKKFYNLHENDCKSLITCYGETIAYIPNSLYTNTQVPKVEKRKYIKRTQSSSSSSSTSFSDPSPSELSFPTLLLDPLQIQQQQPLPQLQKQQRQPRKRKQPSKKSSKQARKKQNDDDEESSDYSESENENEEDYKDDIQQKKTKKNKTSGIQLFPTALASLHHSSEHSSEFLNDDSFAFIVSPGDINVDENNICFPGSLGSFESKTFTQDETFQLIMDNREIGEECKTSNTMNEMLSLDFLSTESLQRLPTSSLSEDSLTSSLESSSSFLEIQHPPAFFTVDTQNLINSNNPLDFDF